MNLYVYIHEKISPIIFIICKLKNKNEYDMLEKYQDDIFKILYQQNIANNETILVFSVFKDYINKKNFLIKTTINSNFKLSNLLFSNNSITQTLLYDIITKINTEYLLEINNDIKLKTYKKNMHYLLFD
jgi:hypothetical protein